jgi:hypothetical protein
VRVYLNLVEHIRCLGFRDKPDYKFLHSILGKCALPQTPKFTDRCVTDQHGTIHGGGRKMKKGKGEEEHRHYC